MVSEKNQWWLVVVMVVFGYLVVQKLERLVVVAERTEQEMVAIAKRTEQKLDRFIEAAAPLGKATVEKGAAMIESVDHEDMSESAQTGIKEIGSAAKQHLLEYMEQKAAEETETSPNPDLRE